MHKLLLYEVGTEKRQSLNFSRQIHTQIWYTIRIIIVKTLLSLAWLCRNGSWDIDTGEIY